jgi:hypothetical protein
MTFTTVGEIIDALQNIDRSTPVLIADPGGSGYYDASVAGVIIYRVVPVAKLNEDDQNYYIDADAKHPHSFDAIVL